MAQIPFAPSAALTLGIEEELLLVDATGARAPAHRIEQVLEGGKRTLASPGGWLKPELLRCTIELATAASSDLGQLEVDLAALRAAAQDRADAANAFLVGIGMHPDHVVEPEFVSDTEAHRAIAELYRRVGTLEEQTIHGIHVHVGMPSLDDAVRVTEALAAYGPVFIAATAHSPIARGVRTPWRSTRTDILRRVPWAGVTPRFPDVATYRAVHALHQLENDQPQRFLWEVAPVPALGTVEVRAFDAHPDPRVALGCAALVQGLAAYVLDGGSVARANESLERHNRWGAMEFGTHARFLLPGRDAPVDAGECIRAAVERARPYAVSLGNDAWLDVFEELIERPPVERVLEAFEADGVEGVMRAARVPYERSAAT